jgi:hypothetical protein
MILRQTMTQKSPSLFTHELGEKRPEIMAVRRMSILYLKKKPLPRINGERKNGKC